MRILVIDDDGLAGEMTAALACDLGHEAVLAGSAAEALGMLDEDGRFDSIVCDLHMPQQDGLGLLRQLRGRGSSLPFILLSGDAPGFVPAGEPGLSCCLVKDAMLGQTLALALAEIDSKRVS